MLTVADSVAVAEHVVRNSAQETAGQRYVSSLACGFCGAPAGALSPLFSLFKQQSGLIRLKRALNGCSS